jgi:hypothetical protein
MVAAASYSLIGITCFLFRAHRKFANNHIWNYRKLMGLVRRSTSTRTIVPVLAEYETLKYRKYFFSE